MSKLSLFPHWHVDWVNWMFSRKQKLFSQITEHQTATIICFSASAHVQLGQAGMVLRELSRLGHGPEKRTWPPGNPSPRERFARFSSQEDPWNHRNNPCGYSVRRLLCGEFKAHWYVYLSWNPPTLVRLILGAHFMDKGKEAWRR